MSGTVAGVEPRYFSEFRCIGAECENTCCGGWGIVLDQATFGRLRGSPDPTIAATAGHYLVPLPGGTPKRFGVIGLDQTLTCPFLAADRLCRIQRRLGETALPAVCDNFPRNCKVVDGVARRSLSLSCPEAARRILLDPSAMMFSERLYPEDGLRVDEELSGSGLPEHHLPMQQLAFEIALTQERPLEERLLLLGRLAELSQGCVDRGEAVGPMLDAFRQAMDDGRLGIREPAPAEVARQQAGLLQLLVHGELLEQATPDASIEALNPYFAAYHHELRDELESAGADLAGRLQDGYRRYFLPYLEENAQVGVNLVLHWIYHEQFPHQRDGNLFEACARFLFRYFYLRAYLSLLARRRGGIDDALVIGVAHSLSRFLEHNEQLFPQAAAVLEGHGFSSRRQYAELPMALA